MRAQILTLPLSSLAETKHKARLKLTEANNKWAEQYIIDTKLFKHY